MDFSNIPHILDIAAIIGVSYIAIRAAVGYAIKDQRLAAEAEATAKIEAVAERKLKPLRDAERRRLDKLNEIRQHAKEVRSRLPVWGKWNETTDEIQNYAKKCLKLEYDGRNIKVYRQYFIEGFDDASSWLHNVGLYYFHETMASYELAIARANLALTKTQTKISKLEGNWYYHKAKEDAKRTVAYLEVEHARRDWELKHYLNYCLIMHDKGWAKNEPMTAPLDRFRTKHADKLANELTGPRPAVVEKPPGFYPELRWDTNKKDHRPLTDPTSADAVTTGVV